MTKQRGANLVPATPSAVEKATRAAYDEMDRQASEGSRPWLGRSSLYRERFAAGIRAAIGAMREPTEAMLNPNGDDGGGEPWDALLADGRRLIWQAMIDAALSADGAGNCTASTTDLNSGPGSASE